MIVSILKILRCAYYDISPFKLLPCLELNLIANCADWNWLRQLKKVKISDLRDFNELVWTCGCVVTSYSPCLIFLTCVFVGLSDHSATSNSVWWRCLVHCCRAGESRSAQRHILTDWWVWQLDLWLTIRWRFDGHFVVSCWYCRLWIHQTTLSSGWLTNENCDEETMSCDRDLLHLRLWQRKSEVCYTCQ